MRRNRMQGSIINHPMMNPGVLSDAQMMMDPGVYSDDQMIGSMPGYIQDEQYPPMIVDSNYGYIQDE